MDSLLKSHRLLIGVLADSVTFVGALILARDALFHLRDRQDELINEAFHKEFGDVETSDYNVEIAQAGTSLAIRGMVILLIGFILQLLSRFLEA